ncbi:MAG: DUF1194 domain-containing protein [Variibacter sp.]
MLKASGKFRYGSRRALVGLAAAFFSVAAAAQEPEPVDLQLVLAVDASGSVSNERFELQKQGYAGAFRNRQVIAAITSGPQASIAVTMVQWTGPALQVVVVTWTRISDVASANEFADAIAAAPRRLFGGGTSISGAIDTGVALLSDSRFRGSRRVIDISGDGANNRGRPANIARDEAVAAGIVINGLPILSIEPDLDRYYQNNVIGGPGAFMIVARSYDTFASAILKKLIVEIPASAAHTRAAQSEYP